MLVKDDGGRSSWEQASATFETNDCTVRALANACAVDYAVAHTTLRMSGRKNGEGFSFYNWLVREYPKISSLLPLGVKFTPVLTPVRQRSIPAASFMKTYNTGIYIVGVPHHTFAVYDGVGYDSWDARYEAIQWAVKVE